MKFLNRRRFDRSKLVVRHTLTFYLFIFSLLWACAPQTSQPTPQLVNVYVSSAAYPWVSKFYDCSPTSLVINLSDPLSAEIVVRLGEPDLLSSPAFQISTEEILVVVHPQSGVTSLVNEQVRSLFLGQTSNWKDVGGADVTVQPWVFSPDEDVQEAFTRVVMRGQPVTSLARLATTAEGMLKGVETNPGSIGLLPRHLLSVGVKTVYSVGNVPVLAITKSAPQAEIKELIGCLQENP